jgi:DNA-binding NarL/FixJ family response regulator
MWYATTRAKLASAVAMVLYSRRSSRVGARRIRKLCPESKIVFLSQESSGDVIEEALNSGGTGYVLNLFMKKLTRDRVVPIISARVS